MQDLDNKSELPPIPGKLYFTIGEVSGFCGVKPHVLRYWEQEFLQLNPVKRKGNRRHYQREDLLTIRLIRSLLYEQGYTTEGARRQLNGEKTKTNKTKYKQLINQTLSELDEILLILKD